KAGGGAVAARRAPSMRKGLRTTVSPPRSAVATAGSPRASSLVRTTAAGMPAAARAASHSPELRRANARDITAVYSSRAARCPPPAPPRGAPVQGAPLPLARRPPGGVLPHQGEELGSHVHRCLHQQALVFGGLEDQ